MASLAIFFVSIPKLYISELIAFSHNKIIDWRSKIPQKILKYVVHMCVLIDFSIDFISRLKIRYIVVVVVKVHYTSFERITHKK